MAEYLVVATVSSKDDWDACGMDSGKDGTLTFGFQDHACKAEDLDTEKAADFLASIGLDFKSKEAWEEFKEVGDWVFSVMAEED